MRALSAVALLLATQAAAATLTRGPFLQLADSTSITIVFRTDTPSIGTVRYGSGPLATVNDLLPSVDHVFRLTGLNPSTLYRYEVLVDGGRSRRRRGVPLPHASLSGNQRALPPFRVGRLWQWSAPADGRCRASRE